MHIFIILNKEIDKNKELDNYFIKIKKWLYLLFLQNILKIN